MLKHRSLLRVFAVLALAVTVSCGTEDSGRQTLLEPQLSTVTVGATSYTRIEERAPSTALSASKLIGLLGGNVSLAGHTVTVPFGAVLQSTLFTLQRVDNGYIEVEATALVTDLLGNVLDVGALGFRRDVTLTLSYARATNVTDPSRLKIIRLNPNGRHEVMPSTVNTSSMTVRARLDHFSRYAMVSD